MKIKLSKSQWEFMGRKAGWMNLDGGYKEKQEIAYKIKHKLELSPNELDMCSPEQRKIYNEYQAKRDKVRNNRGLTENYNLGRIDEFGDPIN